MTTVYYRPREQNLENQNLNHLSSGFPSKSHGRNSVSYTKGGMPAKFKGADGESSFAIGRSIYRNINLSKTSTTSSKESFRVQSSDQYIQQKKNQAIGRGTMPGLSSAPNEQTLLSFKSNDNNTRNQALRRCRNRGYVVPPKVKSSTHNRGVCCNT